MGLFRRTPRPAAPPAAPRTPPPPVGGVAPLTDDEVRWCELQMETARVLAQHLAGDDGDLPSLEALDTVLFSGLDADGRIATGQLVTAVGTAFGEHVRRSTGLAWVVATDEHGTELALHADPGHVLVHPSDAVGKRLRAGEPGVLPDLHAQLTAGVLDARARAGGAPVF